MKNTLIFGGSGQIGAATAQHLAEKGWKVTATTRNGRELSGPLIELGVSHINATGLTRTQVASATAGTFDAVIDTTAFNEEDARDLVSLQDQTGAIVTISSSSVYRDGQGRSLDEAFQTGFPELPVGIAESTPTVSPGSATYSTRKVAMEQALQEAKVPTIILRPCAIYGRHARALREAWLLKRIADKRPHIPIAYNAESHFHTSSTAGIASLIRCALENPRSHVLLNVADPVAPSIREIAAALTNAIGHDIPVAPFQGDPVGPVGRSPWSVPRPYVLDTSQALALGWDGGQSYAEAVTDVCKWASDIAAGTSWEDAFPLSEIYGANVFNYEAEDAFLSNNS